MSLIFVSQLARPLSLCQCNCTSCTAPSDRRLTRKVSPFWVRLHLWVFCRYRHGRSPTAIWTNYDLIVREDFYEIVHTQAQAKVGFSALRLDLLIERAKHPSLANWTVGDVFEYDDARPQGGHDCMVFPTRCDPPPHRARAKPPSTLHMHIGM